MKKSRRLLIAVCMLVAAVVAATGTTFAWFTLNNNATIEDVQLKVTSGEDALVIGVETYTSDTTYVIKDTTMTLTAEEYTALPAELQACFQEAVPATTPTTYTVDDSQSITTTVFEGLDDADATASYRAWFAASAGATTQTIYYNELTIDTLKNCKEFVDAGVYYVVSTGQFSVAMNHLTAMSATDTYELKTVSDVNAAKHDYGEDKLVIDPVANVDYLSFTLSFRSSSAEDQSIYLYQDSAVTAPQGAGKTVVAWTDIAAATDDAVGSYGYAGTAAITNGSEFSVYAANAARVGFVDDAGNGKVWDPNPTAGFTTNGAITDLATKDAPLFAAYINDFFGEAPTIFADNYISNQVTPTQTESAPSTGATALCSLTSNGGTYAVGQMTVQIWIEGLDGECFNSIYDDVFNTALSFVCI